jgi:arabinogalactan oligomer / maltooligosaccharide transport system substrate-binding protein
MKKLISLLVLVLVAASFTGCARTLKTCDLDDLDGTVVCYDEKLEQYAIEEGATLVVNVDNDAFGNALVALWDETHPEHAGKVSFVNTGSQGSTDELATQTTEFPDISMAIDGEVSRNLTHMLPFESILANLVKANSIETFYKAGNSTDVTVYAPVTYDGMAFIWNKTMLETLGLSTTDADGDNLPDAFDTWEEIFALATTWKTARPTYNGNPVKTVFPLSLGEVWSAYMILSSAGWSDLSPLVKRRNRVMMILNLKQPLIS